MVFAFLVWNRVWFWQGTCSLIFLVILTLTRDIQTASSAWCIVQTEAGKPTAVPVCFRLQLWVFAVFFFLSTGCFYFGLIPRGLFVFIRLECMFPSLSSIGFFFAGVFVPGNALQYSLVRPTGDVAQPPIFFIMKLVMNFHVAVHSFYVPVCKHCSVTLCFISLNLWNLINLRLLLVLRILCMNIFSLSV